MAAVIALLSGLVWGTADFFGGLASRRLPPAVVVGWSQTAAFVAYGLLAVVVRPHSAGPWTAWLPWAVTAGALGVGGLLAFYRALAIGTMGVVSPIAALGAIVPVLGGLLLGERPGALQVAGIVVALAGAVAASGPELSGEASARSIGLAAVSGLLFGSVTFCMARGATTGAPLLTVVGMRATSVALFAVAALAVRGTGGVRPAQLPMLAAVGICDSGANLLFGLSATLGMVSVVSVLGALYPVATVVLARVVLGERLRPVQVGGVSTALAGVALLSAG